MTRFRFPLQPVLDLCEREERRLHEALLAAWRTHARDRERAQQLRAERVRLGRSLSVPAPAAGAGARDAFIALELVAAAIARQDAALRRSGDREAAVRATFAEARRRRRCLSTLRDRAREAFVRAAERCEARALDEANAAHHNSAARTYLDSMHRD